MNHQVLVVPKSHKAKNRLHNLMDSDPIVTVQQNHETKMFVASSNNRNFFWIEKQNDPNWTIAPIL